MMAKAMGAADNGKYDTDEQRWNAVVGRDGEADGKFYYAVTTTGVYCRPACAARLAREQNVRFFSSCEAAERAGFRACKRCQPRVPAPGKHHAALVAKACDLIKTAETPPRLGALAEHFGMSAFHFHRIFKAAVGITPKGYADAQRAQRARNALSNRRSVTQAIYDAGFGSSSRFYGKTGHMFGMQPKNFRNRGARETIRFAIGECSLGSVLVAASEKGVCAILLGDDPDPLARELQDLFRNATLIGADRKFELVVAQVVGFIDAACPRLDVPLDIRGTAFQQKVWQALQKIPRGKTATYSEIAERLGMPKAIRAVANACAANPLAVAIPCHRVVRIGGTLAGYRWGIERKRSLLERERPIKV
jgi:AraC family transcriptional regulator of adaptative response/methylated-DNA-[protein]-cysteine methyltransferase